MNSRIVDIVFAVNCPPHAPAPGQATDSSACSSAGVIFPTAQAPICSYTSWMVTSRPPSWPGAIVPL